MNKNLMKLDRPHFTIEAVLDYAMYREGNLTIRQTIELMPTIVIGYLIFRYYQHKQG